MGKENPLLIFIYIQSLLLNTCSFKYSSIPFYYRRTPYATRKLPPFLQMSRDHSMIKGAFPPSSHCDSFMR